MWQFKNSPYSSHFSPCSCVNCGLWLRPLCTQRSFYEYRKGWFGLFYPAEGDSEWSLEITLIHPRTLLLFYIVLSIFRLTRKKENTLNRTTWQSFHVDSFNSFKVIVRDYNILLKFKQKDPQAGLFLINKPQPHSLQQCYVIALPSKVWKTTLIVSSPCLSFCPQ